MTRTILTLAALILGTTPAVMAGSENTNVYKNKKLRIQFQVPSEEFTIEARDEDDEHDPTRGLRLCELRFEGGFGALDYFKANGLTPEKLAGGREQVIRKYGTNLKRVVSRKLERKTGKWLLREYTYTTREGETEVHTLNVFVTDGTHNFELLLLVEEERWEEAKESLYSIANSLACGATEKKNPAPKCEKCKKPVKKGEKRCDGCREEEEDAVEVP